MCAQEGGIGESRKKKGNSSNAEGAEGDDSAGITRWKKRGLPKHQWYWSILRREFRQEKKEIEREIVI